MDARTITAIFLMLLIYIFFFQPKAPRTAAPGVSPVASTAVASAEVAKAPLTAAVERSSLEDKILEIKNNKVKAKLSALGTIHSVEFAHYMQTQKDSGPKTISFEKAAGLNSQDLITSSEQSDWILVGSNENSISLLKKGDSLAISRTISLEPDSFFVRLRDEVTNSSKKSEELKLRVGLRYREPPVDEKKRWLDKLVSPSADTHESLYWADHEMFRHAFLGLNDESKTGEITYGGFSEKYFYFGTVFRNFSAANLEVKADKEKQLGTQRYETLSRTLAPGEKTDFDYGYYLGPKDIRALEAIQPEMREIVNYGSWLGPIARMLLSLLHFFYGLIANYGVAIILLTIVVKGLLFPLAFKSGIAMRRMQLIQPKMKALQEKFKNDKQKMQMELMNLYKTEKVNPVGGCLPLLLQMPVFFALYRVFYLSIEFRHEPFFGWIHDLSAHDAYFVTPVLMTVIMWYQMKITPQPPAAEENDMVRVQKSMMKIMPIMFGAFSIFLPSGLNIYLLTNVLLSLIQQVYMNRYLEERFPLPAIPANSAAK